MLLFSQEDRGILIVIPMTKWVGTTLTRTTFRGERGRKIVVGTNSASAVLIRRMGKRSLEVV